MQPFEDLVFAFFLRDVVDTRNALFARGERLRFLLAIKVLLLAQAMQASSRAVVCRCGRCGTKEERLLLDSLGEQLVRGVGGVSALEELVGDMGPRSHAGQKSKLLCIRIPEALRQNVLDRHGSNNGCAEEACEAGAMDVCSPCRNSTSHRRSFCEKVENLKIKLLIEVKKN